MKFIAIDFSKSTICTVIICGLVLSFTQVFAADIVPNTFSTGEVISASAMNENFKSLEQAVNSVSSDVSQAIN